MDLFSIVYSLSKSKFLNVDDVQNFLSGYTESEFLDLKQKEFLKEVVNFISKSKSFNFSSHLKVLFPKYKYTLVELDSFDSFKSLFLKFYEDIVHDVVKGDIIRKANTSSDIADLKQSMTLLDRIQSMDSREFTDMNLNSILNNYVPKTEFYKFYIKELDNLVGSLMPGTVLTVAGWVAHGKSSFAYNTIYKNMREGRDSVLIALEIPKEIVYLILLSRHSRYLNKTLIPYGRLLRNELNEKERNYLTELEESFKQLPGKVIILTLSDIGRLDKTSLVSLYSNLDKKLDNFAAIYIDHVNLFKYVDMKVPGDFYIKLFTELGTSFLTKKGTRILTVFLAQVNREGYKRAKRKDGLYDMTALSDFNELERSSTYVLFVYADEVMVDSKEMKVDLKKHRLGQVMFEPVVVQFDPLYSIVGDDGKSTYDTKGVGLDDLFNLDF